MIGLLVAMGVLLPIGIGFCALGVFVGYSQFTKDFITQEVTKQTRLEEGSDQYSRWADLPFPFEFKIYVFNVTNPEEIVNKGAKPIVKEIGPFVYHERFHKKKVEYNQNDDTYNYSQYLDLEFQKDLSVFDDSYKVTVLNVPLQGIFQSEEEGDLPASIQTIGIDILWSRAFHGDSIFVQVPVRDFFFKGYQFCNEDKVEPHKGIFNFLLDAAAKTQIQVFCRQVMDVAGSNPTIIPEKKRIRFSMFSYKNNNTDGRYQISAGLRDVNTLGAIKTWNKRDYLDVWKGGRSECNHIRGTDSALYPPFNNQSSFFLFYNTDLCRVVKLSNAGLTAFQGITGIKAVMNADNMANDGDNSCYCIKKSRNLDGKLDCFPQGFCDMHNCLQAPIITSYPHMLWAEERYRDSVEGLSPDEDKHSSFISMEPTTGTLMQGRKRIQFNMVLRKIDAIRLTRNLKSSMLPILWVEEGFDLPDKLVAKLKGDFVNKMKMLDMAVYTLIGSGFLCFGIASGILFFPLF